MISNIIGLFVSPIAIIIAVTCFILCLFSKTIRTIISSSMFSSLIPFVLTFVRRFDMGLSGVQSLFEKSAITLFDAINRLQPLFTNKKDILVFLMNAEKEMSIINIISSIHFVTNIRILIADLKNIFDNIEIKTKNEFNKLEQIITRRVNMSKLSIDYRV